MSSPARITVPIVGLLLVLVLPVPASAGTDPITHSWTVKIGGFPYGLVEWSNRNGDYTTFYFGKKKFRFDWGGESGSWFLY